MAPGAAFRVFVINPEGSTRWWIPGRSVPFACTKPVDGLALEVRQGFLRPGFSVDAAYRLVLTAGPYRCG